MPFSGTPGEHSFLKYHSAGGGGGGSRAEKEDDNGEWYTAYEYGGNDGSGGGGSCGEYGNYAEDIGGSGYQGIIYVRIPLDQSIYN